MQKRNITLLIVTLVIAFGLHAQNVNRQWQFQFDNTVRQWQPLPDNSGWFGAGWSLFYPGYPMATPFVIRMDPSGAVQWIKETPLPLSEDIQDMAILPQSDGSVVVGVVYSGCDYETTDAIYKLDANGALQWLYETDLPIGASKCLLAALPNGNIMFQTNYYQVEFKPNGTILYDFQSPFSWKGASARSNGGYLVYGDHKIGTTNWFQSIIPQNFPDNLVHALQLDSGDWLLLGKQSLWRTNATFQITDSLPLSNVLNYSRIAATKGSFWVNTESGTGAASVIQIDTATFSVAGVFNSGADYRIKSILPGQGQTLLLSGESNLGKNALAFLKSEPVASPVIAPELDLAITNIRTDPAPHYVFAPCPIIDPPNSFNFEFTYATVFNKGNMPVTEFTINGRFSECTYICNPENQVSLPFSGIWIEPGDSVEVLLFSDFSLFAQPYNDHVELCFWVSSPERQLDADPSNDKFCKSFQAINPVKDPGEKITVNVAPVPATDKVRIVLNGYTNSEKWEFRLFDAQGRQILTRSFEGSNIELERGKLRAGLYSFSLFSHEGGYGNGKILFVD